MAAAESTTLYVGQDHCAAIYRNLLVMVVHEDPRPDLVQHQQRWMKELAERVSGPKGFMVVLRPDNPPPAEEARGTIRRAFQQFGEGMSFGAMVVEKTGFKAAAQRGALTMIILAARPAYPLKVFATVAEATRWIVDNFGAEARLSLTDVMIAVERLKASYDGGTLRVG